MKTTVRLKREISIRGPRKDGRMRHRIGFDDNLRWGGIHERGVRPA